MLDQRDEIFNDLDLSEILRRKRDIKILHQLIDKAAGQPFRQICVSRGENVADAVFNLILDPSPISCRADPNIITCLRKNPLPRQESIVELPKALSVESQDI